MSACIAHRGPDGQGLYLNHEQEITPDRPQVGLVHRRLAIIDLDPRANQPFTDGRGRWIVFNGEIYNYRELREELKRLKPDYEWKTTCDTEVLLVAYDAWGEKCVEHLNGMFAFAVWDERERSLYLARDRMGQKPLYIALTCALPPDHIVAAAFSSELRALRSLTWVHAPVSARWLATYLSWGCGSSDQGVLGSSAIQLKPSTTLLVSNQSHRRRKYFDANNASLDPEGTSVPATSPRDLIFTATRRQLVSDVPLGCFLSGGTDSSVIAACMKAAVEPDQPVLTFSIGFDDPRYDETEYAAAVARHLGTMHHQFVVRPNAAEDLPKLAAVFGEPFGDSSCLPTHYLARETRAHVKVALSGDGGDELFGGYDRYRAMRADRVVRSIPHSLRRAMSRCASSAGGPHPKSNWARLHRFLQSIHLDAPGRYASYLRFFSDAQLRKILLQDPQGALWVQGEYMFQHQFRDAVQSSLAADRVTYLPDDLLTKLDRASMLHALEVRSPFMDHELVQFAAGLTTDQLLKGGPKRMLREAFAADLPDFVFKRKKMGFAVPIGEWFRAELRPMLHDHLFAADSFAASHFNMPFVRKLVEDHEQFREDHSQRLYALLMLELWWRNQKS